TTWRRFRASAIHSRRSPTALPPEPSSSLEPLRTGSFLGRALLIHERSFTLGGSLTLTPPSPQGVPVENLAMSPEEVDDFLSGPLRGQLASNGPTIRPLWYQWEDKAFWIISGPWAKLHRRVQKDPGVAFCVDVGDFDSGIVKQVIAHGSVQIHDYD